MKVESYYSGMCEEIKTIRKATIPKVNYFNLDSPDWWKSIPAEVIPMSGGIYNDESWEVAKKSRDELVNGRTLGDLKLDNLAKGTGELELILSVDNQECGEVNDIFNFSVALIADFDEDGIAELLLNGYRMDKSDSCALGSGNSLGADFRAIIKKDDSAAPVFLMPFPLTE